MRRLQSRNPIFRLSAMVFLLCRAGADKVVPEGKLCATSTHYGRKYMKSKLLAAATCAVLSFAASAAYAQGAAGDGVTNPGSFPLAAPAGKDSGARSKALPGAVNQGPYNVKTWKFGHRTDPIAGSQLWNPAKIKMVSGGKLYSATLDPQRQTPDQYCAAANETTNDFIWTEMQHSSGTWHDAALMWNQCPHAHAVPGARIPNANEMD